MGILTREVIDRCDRMEVMYTQRSGGPRLLFISADPPYGYAGLDPGGGGGGGGGAGSAHLPFRQKFCIKHPPLLTWRVALSTPPFQIPGSSPGMCGHFKSYKHT